jgi:hypothetical protein
MKNPWIEHIKRFSKKHNITYACALSKAECRESYKQKKPMSSEESSSAGASEYINKVRFFKKVKPNENDYETIYFK